MGHECSPRVWAAVLPPHVLGGGLWADTPGSPCFLFLHCSMELIMVYTSWGCSEDTMS